MIEKKRLVLLVGDNPFQGISHLSQLRSRARDPMINSPQYCAKLIVSSSENGANGFMFSVSETTLAILRAIRQNYPPRELDLYAIVPYAYEYVRMATQSGGISGLAKQVSKRILLSGNVKALTLGLSGFVRMDPESLLKTYLTYEISRIKSSAGKGVRLRCVLLHEIITEMALALKLNWLLRSFIDFTLDLGITPGFETRNFPYLVSRFKEWGIDLHEVIIATPFNKVGFQMNPSRAQCEEALKNLPEPVVIAMSVLAAGYLGILEAKDYLKNLPNLKGVVVGVSKEEHAFKTFKILKEA